MAINPYIDAAGNINKGEVFRRAWSQARRELALDIKARRISTLRQCFAAALRSQWDLAKGYRAIALWRIERDAAFAVASVPQREMMALKEARVSATMIDAVPRMIVEVEAIDARISALRLAA